MQGRDSWELFFLSKGGIVLRILMVLMGLEIGGAETHVTELAIALKDRGYDIEVASNGGVYAQELEQHGIMHHCLPLNRRKASALIKII